MFDVYRVTRGGGGVQQLGAEKVNEEADTTKTVLLFM
jgi:hypothetical protein